jgi:hypothetical protein
MDVSAGADRPAIGRALAQVIAGIDLEFDLPPSEVPHAVRRRLQAALDSTDLFLDCAQLLLSQLAWEPETRYLYFDPQSRYNLQLFSWPPGFSNPPHFHTNWNASTVMAGSLVIFRSTTSEADCLASTPLVVTAGQAGVLIPPQYHFLRNLENETAITFHVFSIEQTSGEGPQLEGPATSGASRIDDDGILALAVLATQHGGARAVDILRTAFTEVGNATKLELIKLMTRVNQPEAIRMGKILSQLVGGQDGRRLLALVERMEHAG